MLTVAWLFGTANASGSINAITFQILDKAAKTSISASLPSSDAELDLSAFQSISPLHVTVEKKEMAITFLTSNRRLSNFNIGKVYLSNLSAVIATKIYNLLFPFHHFW
jgi:hypothetical protein